MLLDYLKMNFKNGEPIFLNEIPYTNKNALRQAMKRLVDKGEIKREISGVYYVPYKMVFGLEGGIGPESIITKKFIKEGDDIKGYFTGYKLASNAGLTMQYPFTLEICSNEATTLQRNLVIDGRKVIIYKPKTKITKDNVNELQFLDLIYLFDKYYDPEVLSMDYIINRFIKNHNVDLEKVKDLAKFYPAKIYKCLYEKGIKLWIILKIMKVGQN